MTEYTFYSKLFHVVVITLIAVYVVFVEKNRRVVESVSMPVKLAHAPHANNRSYQKG